MQFEETAERLVVRHEARAWFIKFMGYAGLFLLPMSILMAVVFVVTHEAGMQWLNVVGTFLFGVFGVVLLLRAPLRLEIVADRGTKKLLVRRVFRFGADEKEYAFSEVEAVTTSGAKGANMSVVTCLLRLAGGGTVALVEEGGFAAAQADSLRLAEKLSTFLGVPIATR
jgi:hypothetical protein